MVALTSPALPAGVFLELVLLGVLIALLCRMIAIGGERMDETSSSAALLPFEIVESASSSSLLVPWLVVAVLTWNTAVLNFGTARYDRCGISTNHKW